MAGALSAGTAAAGFSVTGAVDAAGMITDVFAAGGGTVAVNSAMLSLARAKSEAMPSSC